jgi:hypothetical protein
MKNRRGLTVTVPASLRDLLQRRAVLLGVSERAVARAAVLGYLHRWGLDTIDQRLAGLARAEQDEVELLRRIGIALRRLREQHDRGEVSPEMLRQRLGRGN